MAFRACRDEEVEVMLNGNLQRTRRDALGHGVYRILRGGDTVGQFWTSARLRLTLRENDRIRDRQ